MFGKQQSSEQQDAGPTRAEKLQAALDPAWAHRMWSALDNGPAARQRDVMRHYEQIKVSEQLLAEQQETNRLLRQLVEGGAER